MNIIGYNKEGFIIAKEGEFTLSIPNDLSNRHRQIVKKWEDEGNVIPNIEDIPETFFRNLEPDQFWFILRVSGYEEALKTWIANLNDPDNENYNPVEWAQVSSKLEFAKFFERENPLIEYAREALGISEDELDALWLYGQS